MALTVGTSRWCLMSDNYIIASSANFTTTLHQVVKTGCLINQQGFELNGEGGIFGGKIFKATNPVNSDIFRMYISQSIYGGDPWRVILLYTSTDGINWNRPDLFNVRGLPTTTPAGTFNQGDGGHNHIVIDWEAQVHYDPITNTWRKTTGQITSTDTAFPVAGHTYISPPSSDGIQFTTPRNTAPPNVFLFDQQSDGAWNIYWNSVKGQYYVSLRGWCEPSETTLPGDNGSTFGREGIWLPLGANPYVRSSWDGFTSTIDKYLPTANTPGWPVMNGAHENGIAYFRATPPGLAKLLKAAVFPASPGDNGIMYPLNKSGSLYNDLDPYGTTVFDYQLYVDPTAAPLFITTPAVLHRSNAKLDIYFAYSRDGEYWQPFTPYPLIPLGNQTPGQEEFDSGYMYDVGGFIVTGTGNSRVIRHYYTPGKFGTHAHFISRDQCIAGGVLRLDGWISRDAGATQATATSVDIVVPNGVNALFWNVNAQGGSFEVQLTNTSNVPLAGFAFANHTPITTDSLDAQSVFTGSIASLAGQTIRFNLRAQNAKVYSFHFGNLSCTPPVATYPSSNALTATVGTALTYTPTTWTNTPPTTASIIGTLPAGLSFNSSTGVISGTPTASGTGTFIVQVADSCSTIQTTISYTITSCTSPSFVLPLITTGTVGTALTITPTSVVGIPLTWSFSGGSGMPAGLTQNISTGVISGTPTAPGWYTISIAADNTCGQFTQSIAIQLLSNQACSPPVVSPSIIIPGTLNGGQVVYVVPDANAQFTTTCPDVSTTLLNKVQLPNGCWQYSIQINDNSGTATNCTVCEAVTAQNRFPILLFAGFNDQNGFKEAIYPYYGTEPASTGANIFLFRADLNNLAFDLQVMNDAQAMGKKVMIYPGGGVINLPNANLNALINTLKTHPALYGWFIVDEALPQFGWTAAQVQTYNAHFKTLDPSHPTMSGVAMLYPLGSYDAYMGITDITTLTYYPINATSNCGYLTSFSEYTTLINYSAGVWNALTPAQRVGKTLSVTLQNWQCPYCNLPAPTYADLQQMWTIAKASVAGADFQFAMDYVWADNGVNQINLSNVPAMKNAAAQWATVHKYDSSIFSIP